jgi:hypothetical protein
MDPVMAPIVVAGATAVGLAVVAAKNLPTNPNSVAGENAKKKKEEGKQ